MKKYNFSLLLGFVIFLLSSCEDVINPVINSSKPTLIVDAMITNEPTAQTIRLSETIGYLDNSQQLPPVLGATVEITDSLNQVFKFIDTNKNGNYTWQPTTNNATLGNIGTNFTLTVINKNETFKSSSSLNRTALFDSLKFELKKEGEFGTGSKEGYYAILYARDNKGIGDCYRIKTFRNDTLYAKSQELNLAYDASFSKGGSTDGTSFILPIRNAINRRTEVYKIGDKVQVDIISLTEPTFEYYNRIRDQQQNGGLFANPPANVGTNIINANKNSQIQALGWFCVSERKTKTIIIKK